MKIRRGFVSNSSSSSFILFMPKEKISISKIEEYFDGYSDKLDQKQKDLLTLAIWRAQYMQPGFEGDRYSSKEDNEVSYKCLGEYICYYQGDFDEHYPESKCLECKYCKRIERPSREDDYYELIDRYSDNEEMFKKIKENSDKSIYRLEVDDNEPPNCMTFDETYELRRIMSSVENTDKIISEYE